MAKSQILLDSNAYLRLAENLNPLLNSPFGADRTRLFVIREFEQEFKRSARLQAQFNWVREQPYVLNRKRPLPIPRDKRRQIQRTESALIDHTRTEGMGVSPVDSRALAIGRVLKLAVVTDDRDMRKVADVFKIRTMRTLALLKKMLQTGHIDIDTVRAIAIYWQVTNDRPANFRSDYRRIFGEQPPKP